MGNIHVKMTEQVLDARTGEMVDVESKNFDMAVVQAPSMTDKVKIGLSNLADKAKVELLNASLQVKDEVLAAAVTFKEDVSAMGSKTADKLVHAKDQFVRDVNDRILDKNVEGAIASANQAIERADQVIREAEITLQESQQD
jgi:hypothetical protein